MKFNWKFPNPNWKSDAKEITLNGLHVIGNIVWTLLCVLFGGWAVALNLDTSAIFNQHGEQILTTWLIIWFVVSLAEVGLEWWLNRKEATA